jgi:hypothetical protein
MSVDIKELEAKLEIDEHALDIALREHPDLVYDVTQELALAVSHRDMAKLELDEIEAEIDKDIRKDASINDEKVTEKEVESIKKTHQKVKAANRKFLEEKFNAAKWTALKDAYEQRSYALSKLVDLYLTSYFSTNENTTGSSRFKQTNAENIKRANALKRVSPK